MRWVGEHLIEYSKKEESERLRPYTMQEIDDMLDEAEATFEAGDYLTNDEVFHYKENVGYTGTSDGQIERGTDETIS